MTASDNAVRQRVDTLQSLHEVFTAAPKARLALWRLAADEYGLFRAFVDRETDLGAQTADLFLLFDSPFKGKADYAAVLTGELVENVDNYNSDHEQHDIRLDWQPSSKIPGSRESPGYFFKQLADFAQSLEHLGDAKVIAYLLPTEVSNWNRLADWLHEAIEQPWPESLRLYLIDFIEQPVLDKLSAVGGDAVMVLQPDLDVAEMMKEISHAAAGDQPGGVFQRHFIDLAKAASKRQMAEVDKHANLALSIAVAEDWKHLQLSVYSTVGTAWMNEGKMEKAMAEFKKAENVARIAFDQKEAGAPTNLANTLFYQGAVLTTTKQYQEAADVYTDIIPILEGEDTQVFTLLEAWRMKGQSHELARAHPAAVEAYLSAMTLGETIEEVHRQHSTMPYVGAALIRLVEHGKGRYQNRDIDQKMTDWFGRDWQPKNDFKT